MEEWQTQKAVLLAGITDITKEINNSLHTLDNYVREHTHIFTINSQFFIIFVYIVSIMIIMVVIYSMYKKLNTKNEIITVLKDVENINKLLNNFSITRSTTEKAEPSSKKEVTDKLTPLVTALADRLTFMEVTLSRMDSKIKGHKQLVKMISQIKDNLLVNGYEIVDMLGKKYDSGMKVIANFVEDETLPSGSQIITAVSKPQINLNGIMIQSAQITVSQNI